MPVNIALFFLGRCFKVSAKVEHIFVAKDILILLAKPGVISDSWIMDGTRFNLAPNITGTVTKPPLEKKSGQALIF